MGAKRVLVGGLTLRAMAMSLYLVTREAWHFYVDPGHQGRATAQRSCSMPYVGATGTGSRSAAE